MMTAGRRSVPVLAPKTSTAMERPALLKLCRSSLIRPSLALCPAVEQPYRPGAVADQVSGPSDLGPRLARARMSRLRRTAGSDRERGGRRKGSKRGKTPQAETVACRHVPHVPAPRGKARPPIARPPGAYGQGSFAALERW